VPLNLAKYEGEQLVSRSQAKRLLMRVEHFDEALLDFKNVEMIGQAFADEVFRIFRREHPKTQIVPINLTPDVERMIAHALVNAEEERDKIELPL
jgi:hypothetical protein